MDTSTRPTAFGRFFLKSPGFLPFVGIFIGIILVIVNFILGFLLPTSIVVLFLVLIMAGISGFKNINGLVNMISGWTGAQHVVSSSIIIAILLILLKIRLLENIQVDELNKTLILMSVFGRWIGSISMFLCPLTTESLVEADISPNTKIGSVFIFSIIAFLIAFFSWWIKGISIFMIVLGFGILFALLIRVKFEKNTEETFRAGIEITEIITLIFIYLLTSRGYNI